MIKEIHGFTLIELSVVLFIISLLMAGLLGPVATQIEARERQETIDTMNDIMESLYGFAVINGRLPCPDTTGNGISNPLGSGTCTIDNGDGWLPWQTLGINIQGDVWGNRFKYHVNTPGFTVIDDGICSDGAGALGDFDLCQILGGITISTRGDDPTTGALETKYSGVNNTIATNIPVVIISHGKNGLGATSVSTGTYIATTANTDEDENCGDSTDVNCTNDTFYSRTYSQGGAGCTDDAVEANFLCQFDDIVMWISPNILMNRMIKAEKLP